jgi:hypothetical protein
MSNETKRSPGRPSSFPGQELVPVNGRVPTATGDMLREMVFRRKESPSVILNRLIVQAYERSNRSRKEATSEAEPAA